MSVIDLQQVDIAGYHVPKLHAKQTIGGSEKVFVFMVPVLMCIMVIFVRRIRRQYTTLGAILARAVFRCRERVFDPVMQGMQRCRNVAADLRTRLLSLARWLAHRPAIIHHWLTIQVPFWFWSQLERLMVREDRDVLANRRELFRNTVIPTNPPDSTNSHPRAAAQRSNASCALEQMARRMGLVPYYIQQSNTDQRRGREGCREWFWAKDVAVPRRLDDIAPDHAIVVVDVDFYLNMPQFMLDHAEYPILLYTINPTEVAGESNESTFFFTKDNKIEWLVAGAATYSHWLWDWNKDVVCVGGWWKKAIFQVERVDLGQHRTLVGLFPIARYWFPGTWVFSKLESSPVERMHVAHGKYARLRVKTPTGVLVSTGLLGMACCATIPESVDSAIAVAARINKTEITIPAISTWIAEKDRPGLNVISANLVEYHREHASDHRTPGQIVFPAAQGVRTYRIAAGLQETKPSMIAFCSPIIHASFAPDVGALNEKWSIQSRVLALENTEVTVRRQTYQWMDEFIEKLIPVPHRGVPCDDDEVRERQPRPTQQRLLDEADQQARARHFCQSFMKKESYGDVKDPRTISTIDSVDKREYSKFTYPFAAHMKTAPWYAFGKTPLETARRVALVCQRAKSHLVKTDFSRMDGRVNWLLRELERRAKMRFFAKEFHNRLITLMRTQHHVRVASMHGVKYLSLDSRLSGSPETSEANTLDNAFIAYACFRDAGMTPDESWEALGVYGGDDGCTADADPEQYTRVAKWFGMALEATVVPRGAQGVDFLARWYGPEVWFGSPISCTDIPRALAKFHVTTNMPTKYTPERKFYEKALSLYCTDRNTPGLKEIIRKAFSVNPDFVEQCEGILKSWHAVPEEADQYPNLTEDWMIDRLRLECPGIDLQPLEQWASDPTRKMLEPPLVVEPKPVEGGKVHVEVQGEIIPAKGATMDEAILAAKEKEKAASLPGDKDLRPPKKPKVRICVRPRGAGEPAETGPTRGRGRGAPRGRGRGRGRARGAASQ